MADRGDGHLSRALVDTVEDEVGLTRYGKTPRAAPDLATGMRVLGQQAQRRRNALLDKPRRLRVAGFEVGGDPVEIVLGARGETQLQGWR